MSERLCGPCYIVFMSVGTMLGFLHGSAVNFRCLGAVRSMVGDRYGRNRHYDWTGKVRHVEVKGWVYFMQSMCRDILAELGFHQCSNL